MGAIVNRSTGAVKVSSLQIQAVNGWTLVPYGTDMAHQKVDAKIIGFSIAGTQTRNTGTTESLTLDSSWTIPQDGSLALPYDAVVFGLLPACSGAGDDPGLRPGVGVGGDFFFQVPFPSEGIVELPLEQLHPFRDHPFKVLDDDAMRETVEERGAVRRLGTGHCPA